MQLHIKRIVLLMTIIALGLLCACEKKASLAPASASPSDTISMKPSSSATVSTLEDVMKIIASESNTADIPVTATTNVGADFVLVEYSQQAYNEFFIYNKLTGAYNILARDAKLVKAENENHLIFEVIGDWDEGGFLHFPYIEEYIRQADSESGRYGFYVSRHSEFYALDRSVKGGSHEGDKLSVINATFDGLELLFKPASAGSAFYAAASYIPPTSTSYNKSANQITIELDRCQLDNNVKQNVDVKTDNNAYISAYKISQKDDIIYITLTLRTTPAGYTMGSAKVPGEEDFDGYPYLFIKFTNADNMAIAVNN